MYPFLDKDDPRLRMSNEEIIRKEIDLDTDCQLTSTERDQFLDILCKHDEAFSLHGEPGTCEDIVVKFKLNEEGGFYIRPYVLSSEEKVVVDRELEKLRLMGIIDYGTSQYTSPILVHKKPSIPGKQALYRRLSCCKFPCSYAERTEIWEYG